VVAVVVVVMGLLTSLALMMGQALALATVMVMVAMTVAMTPAGNLKQSACCCSVPLILTATQSVCGLRMALPMEHGS